MKSIETGVWGAHHNVLANLRQVKDKEFCDKVSVISEFSIWTLMSRILTIF